jgi:hypothetical protein
MVASHANLVWTNAVWNKIDKDKQKMHLGKSRDAADS